MLSKAIPKQIFTANRWLNRQLWQQDSPAFFIDPLLESINPMWVRGQVRAQVVKVRSETPDTRTFTLRPSKRWKGFEAGQHASVTAEIKGVRQTRTFSLSSGPERFKRDGLITFTIKRIEDGRVTPWLHEQLKPGDVVGLSEAFGEFTLPRDKTPLFYLAGGSGITPILSHLESLAASNDTREIGFVYMVRDREHLIAANRIESLQSRLSGLKVHIIYTNHREKTPALAAADVRKVAESLAQVEGYLCGPIGLLDYVRPVLDKLGARPDHFHQALFTPPVVQVEDGGAGSLVRAGTGEVMEGDGKSTLLEIAEQGGLKPTHGCRQGVCRQCSCKKTSGVVMNRLNGQLSGPGEETIQPCISLPQGAVTLEL
ncbi:ferredoxin reductase [Hydrocarboniclastica marina]|uniref:Ferredoxin reductase n=1 Tax=Hydrocarboniclastica marina TaxID=2259620 RepID=A0A4P7XIM7_9ALTE|nr:ferredoxin reductase [Hydrocarboniclastica marina]QCF26878.1 ferredoxin reductase [Hydrocarboniclastica marina]